ncbi:hypothetical protein AVEN_73437-1 [Araneus ventricosus]|uniref:Uncharacterized protein n=1 Tax=Araneus ventricosus TaxID=182803 RepID=A0A4Y2GLQ4_ARAVE|nr:hypothetical protein AVEN_73437-1 [Araneus ventricosus]
MNHLRRVPLSINAVEKIEETYSLVVTTGRFRGAIVEEVAYAIPAASASSPERKPFDFWPRDFLIESVYQGHVIIGPHCYLRSACGR